VSNFVGQAWERHKVIDVYPDMHSSENKDWKKLNVEHVDLSLFLPEFNKCFISIVNLAGVNIIQSNIQMILTHLKSYVFELEYYYIDKKVAHVYSEGRKLNVFSQFAKQVLNEGYLDYNNGSTKCSSKYSSNSWKPQAHHPSKFCVEVKFLNYTASV